MRRVALFFALMTTAVALGPALAHLLEMPNKLALPRNAYFVHSFQLKTTKPDTLLATTEYGGMVTAVVGRDNLAGTQFHPEKSQATGLRLIGNFLRWKP